MQTFPDGSFKPNEAISRGEFTVAFAKLLKLLPDTNTSFPDLEDYPERYLINSMVSEEIINGYPDNTFQPERKITRAEIITIIMRALGIKSKKETIKLDKYMPFKDIPENHWAIDYIKIAKRIDIISGDPDNNFRPDGLTSRAEAAKILSKVNDLNHGQGYIADVYPTSSKISVNLMDGIRKIYKFSADTLIGRNNRLVSVDNILKTDKIFIISDINEEVKYIKAYGMITEEDLASEVSKMTNNILEAEDVKKLAQGDLNILKPKLKDAVENQLLEQGLSHEEVIAIINTNWDRLEELSKERLAEAVAIKTGLPLDITRGLLDGDWNKIKTYAQIEIVQRLVQEVLNSDLIS